MTYNLFLDDERDPPNGGREWVVCRTVGEAKATIMDRGFPAFISFDNDLGEGQPEGRELAKAIVDLDIVFECMSPNFGWYAHTQNPVARDAINGLLESNMQSKSAG